MRDAIDVHSSRNFRGYVPMGFKGSGVPLRQLEAFQIILDLGPDDPEVHAGRSWLRDVPAVRAGGARFCHSISIRVKHMVRTLRQDRRQSPMTMKSTLIVPTTLLAALAAGVLVHDRLRTKSFVQDAAPTRTASIATAEPAAPAPLSPPPVSAPVPAFVENAAPPRIGSIATANPAAPAP